MLARASANLLTRNYLDGVEECSQAALRPKEGTGTSGNVQPYGLQTFQCEVQQPARQQHTARPSTRPGRCAMHSCRLRPPFAV